MKLKILLKSFNVKDYIFFFALLIFEDLMLEGRACHSEINSRSRNCSWLVKPDLYIYNVLYLVLAAGRIKKSNINLINEGGKKTLN